MPLVPVGTYLILCDYYITLKMNIQFGQKNEFTVIQNGLINRFSNSNIIIFIYKKI